MAKLRGDQQSVKLGSVGGSHASPAIAPEKKCLDPLRARECQMILQVL